MAGKRIHVGSAVLPGSDDRLVTVTFDRALGRIGGIWQRFRAGLPVDGLTLWDQHGEAWALSDEERGELRAAAREEAKRYVAAR